MKVFMTGGTGFVGTLLTKKLTEKGHEVTVLTRTIKEGYLLPEGASFHEGDPTEEGPWQEEAPGHEAIINLAGSPIFGRWTAAKKKEMLESRVKTTRNIVEALSRGKTSGAHLLSASAIGYYGSRGDEEITEASAPGNDFLSSIAKEWESAALAASASGTRVAICRFGLVLGRGGGILEKIIPLFKRKMGSPLGSGKQWFSWIHEDDLAHIFLFLLDHAEISGPVNCTAPNPVRNKEMTTILNEVFHAPIKLPSVPGFMIKALLGEFSSVILDGQKVIPKNLLDAGFRFQFPDMKEAVLDITEGI